MGAVGGNRTRDLRFTRASLYRLSYDGLPAARLWERSADRCDYTGRRGACGNPVTRPVTRPVSRPVTRPVSRPDTRSVENCRWVTITSLS